MEMETTAVHLQTASNPRDAAGAMTTPQHQAQTWQLQAAGLAAHSVWSEPAVTFDTFGATCVDTPRIPLRCQATPTKQESLHCANGSKSKSESVDVANTVKTISRAGLEDLSCKGSVNGLYCIICSRSRLRSSLLRRV